MASGRGAALVTGGARRVGGRLALEAARLGYDVAVHHRGDAEAADATVASIRDLGRASVRLQGDLATIEAPARLIDEGAAALGELTLLINNASIFETDRLGAIQPAGWDRHMAINLRSPVLLCQAFAAQVAPGRADGEALVVNMVDQRVLKPNPQFFSYTVSKAALWAATRTAAQALAPRVRVNAIGPGPTLASIHQDARTFAREAASTPLGRGASLDDLAAALAYFVDARAVTGQMIAVDGGQHLAWLTPDIDPD